MNTEKFQKIKKYILPAITAIALCAAVFMYFQLHTLSQNPQAEAKKEATDLIAEVGKIMVLPQGEIPTIATVSDPALLKDQAFFNNAQKGDKVLIYAQSKKAILYSPSMGKIIEVAPLNTGERKVPVVDNTTPTPAPTPAPVTTSKKK